MLGENTTSGWRTTLWVRCDAMGERLRRKYVSNRALSESDIEDVWATMLTRLVQAPGPNRLPADADEWPDWRLRNYLSESFGHEVARAAARASNADGVSLHSPLEDLAEETHRRGVMWTDAVPTGPEQSIFSRLDAVEYASAIKGDAGPEAATVMFAEAIGASSFEQQQAIGVTTRGRWDTVRGRLEIAANAAARRAHAFVLWVLPDWLLRWVTALVSTGSVPRIGAVGLAVTAVAAGGVGISASTHHPSPRARPLKPVSAATVAAPLKAAQAPVRAIVREQQTRQRAAVADTRRRVAARRKRAESKRKTASAAKATAEHQFAPQPITASPRSATTSTQSSGPSASSRDRSTADDQFGLGG